MTKPLKSTQNWKRDVQETYEHINIFVINIFELSPVQHVYMGLSIRDDKHEQVLL